MKKISIRSWFVIQTLIVVGLVALNIGFPTLILGDMSILYLVGILYIVVSGCMEKKREVLDEFSIVVMNKANQSALKVVLLLLFATLGYAQLWDGERKEIVTMLGVIIAVAYIVRLVVFLTIDGSGIDYDDH